MASKPAPSPRIPRSLRSRPFRPTKGAVRQFGGVVGREGMAVGLVGRPRGFAPTGVLLAARPRIPRSLRSRPFRPTKGASLVRLAEDSAGYGIAHF